MNIAALRDDAIYIVGVGAQTPVGRSAAAAAAAVRCGLSAYAEHPFMFDAQGEPMIVARAAWLPETLPCKARIGTLAVDAAREALGPLDARGPSARRDVHVHLSLSDETIADPSDRREILRRIAEAARSTGLGSAPEPVVEGHAGGLLALENAVRELRRGEAELCIVGGADSWLDPPKLDALDRAARLRSRARRFGFTPGEGAGFCLVTTGAVARRLALSPLSELCSVATARETRLMNTKSVCIGEGLTAAFLGVLDRRCRVAHSYCDFNGETYRADEHGFALCRTADHFEDPRSFTAAAECWGDVGAASGPLALTLAVTAFSRGHAAGRALLAWSSSGSASLRAAVLLKECSISD